MRAVLPLSALLLVGPGCASRPLRHPPTPPPGVLAADAPGGAAVHTAEESIDVAGPGYRGVILPPREGGWMPTSGQIADLEARLPSAMQKAAPYFRRPLKEYFRQYVGVASAAREDTRRWIQVHGVSLELLQSFKDIHPRKGEIMIQDGGDALFEASYDPETGAFTDVHPGFPRTGGAEVK